MRLLIFIHSLSSGGAERVTANLANHWSKQAWDVTVVTLAPCSGDFFPLAGAVRRISLDAAGDSTNLLAALANNARRIRALRHVLQTEKPDIALAMMNTASVLLALAAAGLPVACIGAEREQPSMSRSVLAWSFLRRLAYGRLNAVVALTSETAAWIERKSTVKQLSVIPNAVLWPLPESPPWVSPNSVGQPSRKRLLAVGRLARVKGIDRLLDAFARLAPRHPDWELVIVGEGTERNALQSQINAAGLSGQAFLPGQTGSVADWYRSAQLFVMSSRHEGFPNALMEAMAHGLPAVSFDCEAGPRHIIRHEVDGLLVPAGDVAALTTALDRMMGDGELRERYAARAGEVRERFSESRIQSLWQQLFDKVIDARRR